MKKHLLLLVLLSLFQIVYAEAEFKWNIVTVEETFDFSHLIARTNVDIMEFFLFFNEGINTRVSLAKLEGTASDTTNGGYFFSFLPIQFGYCLFYSDYFFINLYERNNWLFYRGQNDVFESIFDTLDIFSVTFGISLTIFKDYPQTHYFTQLSVFAEYTPYAEFKVGLALELFGLYDGVNYVVNDNRYK